MRRAFPIKPIAPRCAPTRPTAANGGHAVILLTARRSEPDRVPERIITDVGDQPGPERIGDEVTRGCVQVVVFAQRVVVVAAAPDRCVMLPLIVHRTRCARFHAGHGVGQRGDAPQLQQPMCMIRHQHPGQQPGIARRCCGECPAGGCCKQKIYEYGATLPCRGGQQVNAVRRRLPAAAQRAMPWRVNVGHAAMLAVLDHAGYRRLPRPALGIHVATDCQRQSAGSAGKARRARVRSYRAEFGQHDGRGAPGSCGFRTYPSASQCTKRHAPDSSATYAPRRSAPGRDCLTADARRARVRSYRVESGQRDGRGASLDHRPYVPCVGAHLGATGIPGKVVAPGCAPTVGVRQ